MNNKHALRIAVLLISLMSVSSIATAQSSGYSSPMAGTWLINEEFNGKPGRGFQIDVQNDIVVMYFYGYETNGQSSYWLAAGKLPDGSDELTADLGEYEGGMSFGDPIKNALYRGARGKVTIRFYSINRGEICLPNEVCKEISAFNFGYENNSASALLGTWRIFFEDSKTDENLGLYVNFHEVVATTKPGASDRAVGKLQSSDCCGDLPGQVFCDRVLKEPDENSPYYTWMYQCGIELTPGAIRTFGLDLNRNGFSAQLREGSRTAPLVTGRMYGYRVLSATDRDIQPN